MVSDLCGETYLKYCMVGWRVKRGSSYFVNHWRVSGKRSFCVTCRIRGGETAPQGGFGQGERIFVVVYGFTLRLSLFLSYSTTPINRSLLYTQNSTSITNSSPSSPSSYPSHANKKVSYTRINQIRPYIYQDYL